MTAKQTRELEERKFDLRVIERHLREETIEKKEYEDFLKKLPDDASNADYTEAYEENPEEKPTPEASGPGGPTFTSG
jgi:hypothetical protein